MLIRCSAATAAPPNHEVSHIQGIHLRDIKLTGMLEVERGTEVIEGLVHLHGIS